MWLPILFINILGWSRIVTASYGIDSVVAGNRMAAVPLGRSLGEGELDVEGLCTGSGMACQNCTHAITCIPLPVGWLKVPLQRCPDGQTCNAHKRQCSTKSVPECDPLMNSHGHTCEQVGIFPDAYDCRKFHLCSPPADLPDGGPAVHRMALCPRHYGYDPRTAQCTIPLKHGQCEHSPVSKCTKVGEYGVLPLSPNHYYVCLSKRGNLYPQIFVCPHGWYFWDNFCHPEPEPIVPETTEQAATEPTTVQATTSKTNAFFSTDKIPTYAADTFLADKFDLSNYDVVEEVPSDLSSEIMSSVETDNEFW